MSVGGLLPVRWAVPTAGRDLVIVIGQRRNRVRRRGGDRGRDIDSVRGRDMAGVGIRVKVMCRGRVATEVLDTRQINIWGWGKDKRRMNI